MHITKQFEETDPAVLHSLIRAHPLGAWITLADGDLVANHVPLLLDTARGDHGSLVGHVARANPIWRAFSASVDSIVIFQGPETYITPSWYPSKHAHGKAVPTWNYAVVHAHGIPRAIEDRSWLRAHLNQLTDTHEAGQALPWKISDAPEEYLARMIEGIVGIEIPIARLAGKWKTSQNRPEADRLGVIAGLLARGDARSRNMAVLVSRHVPPVPDPK